MGNKILAPLLVIVGSLLFMGVLSCITIAPKGRTLMDILFYTTLVIFVIGIGWMIIRLRSSNH